MVKVKKTVLYIVSSRVLFLLFAATASILVPLRSGYIADKVQEKAPYLVWVWANFDGLHFINIASRGYHNFDFAYFPLYPIILSVFGPYYLYAGISISFLSFLAGLYFLYKITRLDCSEEVANTAILLVCIFPVSFFCHSVYSDALFFLLSTGSFYSARRGQWILSGFLAGLATCTRLSGIALLPALAIEWYIEHSKHSTKNIQPLFLKTGLPFLVLGSLGLLGYMIVLKIFNGDPLLFQKSMIAWKQAGIVFPPQVVFRYLKIFYFVEKNSLVFWIAVLEFVSLFSYLSLSVYVWKKIRASYAVFMIILLLLVPVTGTFAGTPRYILHLFPAFIGLALWLNNKPALKYGVSIFFLVLGFILTSLFTRGYFIS